MSTLQTFSDFNYPLHCFHIYCPLFVPPSPSHALPTTLPITSNFSFHSFLFFYIFHLHGSALSSFTCPVFTFNSVPPDLSSTRHMFISSSSIYLPFPSLSGRASSPHTFRSSHCYLMSYSRHSLFPSAALSVLLDPSS